MGSTVTSTTVARRIRRGWSPWREDDAADGAMAAAAEVRIGGEADG